MDGMLQRLFCALYFKIFVPYFAQHLKSLPLASSFHCCSIARSLEQVIHGWKGKTGRLWVFMLAVGYRQLKKRWCYSISVLLVSVLPLGLSGSCSCCALRICQLSSPELTQCSPAVGRNLERLVYPEEIQIVRGLFIDRAVLIYRVIQNNGNNGTPK